jgi:secondary thiamine-phosphate synthase enzyme
MRWLQKQVRLSPRHRGFHLVTREIVDSIPELSEISVGLAHVFIQHSSASLSLNENADPDVRDDLEMAMNRIVPEELPFTHTAEGDDDMPAHVKASLLGCSLLIPVKDGRLALGTWQGIYLCEHRESGSSRRLVITVFGTRDDSNSD